MYKLLLLGLLCVVGGSVGQILQIGQCNPNVPLVANFNLTQFLGQWYEVARTDTPQGGDCSSINFVAAGEAVTVNHTTVRENFYAEYQGQAAIVNGTAQLALNITQLSNNPIPFWVLSTNYVDFALTYACENVTPTTRRVYLWQLGRVPSLPSEMMQAGLTNIMTTNFGIAFNDLRVVSHTENSCYRLPVIAAGQPVILPGLCNAVRGVANFQADRFLGVWHQIQSYYSDNAGGTCNRAQYSDGGDRVNVVNSQIANQTLFTISGNATVISNDTTGQLNVVLEVLPGVFQSSELLVLGTDYNQWAVTYTCIDIPANNSKQVFSWVASRTRVLPAAAREQVNQVISSLIELNDRYYQITDQSDASCFYFPETVSGEPVVFGGQCNMSIPVVSNFSASDYMGLWHEIQRYPTPFQFGACNNAFYTLGGNGVDVFNTQVLDEQLLTINGLAVPVDDGKLVVSFPVEGTNLTTNTDYWVLGTDYISYSLVYSCRNINDYQQQVTFWKLSRAKQLSSGAETAINNIMSTLTILDQRFFTPTDQTPQGCFYYPEPRPGVPVVFPGTCEANVAVVPNFNLTLFQGTWYEVEAYPKDPQEGQCISHQFSAGNATALNFVSSYVDDQLLGTTNGQLTFFANQTGGQFSLSFVSNGTTISFPYYVVATDYTDYAIVYSCLDQVGTDFRGIWAWKLSRTRQLSNNANTAINNYLNSNTSSVLLSNDYFERVDQSDDACFYFPDLAPGAPVILPGQCQDLPVMPNLDLTRYLGRWRLIESYPADDQVGQCNQATYTLLPDNTVNVYNTEVANQAFREATGIAQILPNGKLNVTFPNATQSFELTILSTDYTNYSIVYGCVNVTNQQRRVQSWKLSRSTTLSSESTTAINAVINNTLVLNQRYYQSISHSDEACFYYPTPGAGPTIFRGQCNESIPVVTNFDTVRYMGLWHDIQSYPVPFQGNNCPNAFYTLNTDLGRVEVFNTQVINNTLDTIAGYATLVPSNDSSAKLEVFFPSVSVNSSISYWVLSTDYTSYALVYSCMNIDDEYRSVSSWKLSRTKALNATALTTINNIVNTIPVLDDRYYIQRDQSPEGCFYFPEAVPGRPVEFPGQCDANIPVVPNFNMTAFQGTWFEVEAYPKDPQPGECVRHDFSSNTSTSLNFESTSVFDQLLGTANGNVTLYPNQTGGRLNLTVIDSNGNLITFPYYVIATDYTSYALVYSCLNISSDFRGIYAWKLSRNRTLSSTANTTINNAMANIDVLSNNYFEPIDQSADACFYFPDLAPGAAVVLPGQCDPNVPVVTNFDAGRYTGRWRLIETYPSEEQLGQCNQAEYAIIGTNTISVYNNEVINQTLSDITGTGVLINATEAKVNVTFPNLPPFQLWVLATDYDSYSLAYGCVNINTEQRRVWSWKLSRNTTLTPEANTAINTVINNTLVLNQRYYQSISHSDEACFYYPTPGAGPTIFRGQCNESIPVVTNFDAVRYMGLWHDIQSYSVPFQDGSCPNAFYSLDSTEGDVNVFNTQVLPGPLLDTINGYANVVPSNDGSAKLLVTFPTVGINSTTPYWVLATDYTSYSLVYSCLNLGPERRSVSSWKLSRTKSLNATAVTIINNIVNTIPVLDDRYYNVRDQSPEGCFYFPEPQPGVPVRFPGQCDLTIPVVSNFSLSRFSGVWHEIESYPKEQQTGDCINHDFVVNGTTFNMQSYNVVAQSLGVTNGVVTLADPTVARMNISFVSNNTTIQIPYWIIDTDYDNYALAYSCVNIDENYRGIWSWKLSRTRQLSQVDSNAIDNATASIDVLGNQYYERVNQTEDSCFFYPEPTGRPVVFPGRCGNVQPMQNFDAARYLGLWRTIESYPSEFQLGTCGTAQYTLGNNVVDVFNTEVINQTLSTINGTAVAATDGTGRLYVTFPTAPEVSEYLILDTDYNTYAIVYSCANNSNGEDRTVYSWKLSRTNTLLPGAVTAINAVINRTDVLDQRYYQTVDRSENGCFYFPEPNNSTVIFRGQCNASIPVQANFNATAYMGIWYNIESYPAPFQGGTCGTANYTLGEGLVYVENSQVIDRELDIQTGYAEVIDNAKLAVTFNVSGQVFTTDYWILATDYSSYSLVYSCQNISDEYKQVNSFKLGRNKTLTAAAQNAINSTMSNVLVLEQRYFVEEPQSDDDCFSYPEIQNGNVILDGQCVPDNLVPAVANFALERFTGVWHEVSRFPSDLQNGQCVATTFAGAQNSLNLTTTIVASEAQSSTIISGTVSGNRGVIATTGAPINALYILDTDYTDYAVVYGCRNLTNSTKQIYSWKLSRSRSGFSPSANATINQLVSDNIDLAPKYYYNTAQTSAACFHYPEYDQLPARIELEGPCDETIRGVPNFDAAAYLGLWIEIESYPEPNQFGTCDRAFYALGDGNVTVRNTQVLGDSLLEQTGTAIVASTDNSGLLSVDFNVNGVDVNANYFILATDYTTYSFVYSCRNIQDASGYPRRIVSSWKLSRNNTLNSQAVAEISRVINQTEGLSASYYRPTGQSAEDCFYIPEVDVNRAPLFRGTCGAASGVANFNASRFAGWWNELERYPVDSSSGECIFTQYTAAGNSFQVVDTAVANGTGVVVSGTMTASANGVLTKVVNGQTQQIVVLGTDYDNYALLYSCVDVTFNGEPYRRVWSAKHSRTRNISSVRIEAIDAIVRNSSVLYEQFYQTVDHSNQACFYYPPVQGQRVILPGQCDENIPVVPNFDVSAYGGTWYQIERYPQVHENPSSTCIGARYLLEGDVVSVLNWEVIDGVLETIEGNATLTSTDGSAQLAVVLPVVGTELTVTTPLYVLATDYESYSIAYSCSNYGPFQRSIGAWKLSRERTMGSAGVAAINNIISLREELNQSYFLSVSHNDDCPEPSSSVIVQSSVAIMLVCLLVQLFY